MADKTINQISEDTSPTADDYVPIWDVGTGTTKKITLANLIALIRSGGSGYAWTSYTPSLVNITLGNGTMTAKFARIGNTIFFRIVIVCGSTTAIGNGITISAPVAAASDYGTANVRTNLGGLSGLDVGTAHYWGLVNFEASTTVFTLKWNDGTSTSSNVMPWAEASGDTLVISGAYEAG